MQNVCPITDKRVNETVARTNALVTMVIALLFLFLNAWFAMALLSVDFIIRGFVNPEYSPLTMFSKWINKVLGIRPKLINAGPKIFAAQVGVVLSVAALALFVKNCVTLCVIFASVLGFFSFLEGAFGFCVACKLYPLFRRVE